MATASAKNKLTAEAQKKLQQAIASDPFLQGDDVHLDLSGCPSVGTLADTSFADHSLAPLIGSGGADSNALKRFLEVETARAEGPSEVHLGKGVKGKLTHDGAEWICDFTVGGQTYRTKNVTRDDCVMSACRYVFNRKLDIRKLDESELRFVAWIAQTGNIQDAAAKYLELACPGVSDNDLLTNAKYAAVLDEAVWLSWSYGHDDYSLSDRDFLSFVKRFANGKRLTVSLLDAAWAAYKGELAKQERAELLQPRPLEEQEPSAAEIAAGLEELSDAQVEETMKRVIRSRAGR